MPGAILFHSLVIFEYSHVFRSGGSLMDKIQAEFAMFESIADLAPS
jgi:hypothetical protein